jgi:hypothetical protein
MRRVLVLVLIGLLGFGGLAACGKKAPPRLPEGEQLKVGKGKRSQHLGVTTPAAPEDEQNQDTTQSPSDLDEDTDIGETPDTVQPSPGGPEEPGF